MSARAPAGIASRNTGAVVAACTNATINGLGVSDVMSQPAPTSCIHEPIFEKIEAIHNVRNTLRCKGAHGDADKSLTAVFMADQCQAPFIACCQVRNGMHVCNR